MLEATIWTRFSKDSIGIDGQCWAACRLIHLVTAVEEQHVTRRRDDSGSVGRGSIRRPEQVSRIFWGQSTIPDMNWPLDGSEQKTRRREKRKIPLMAKENLFEAPPSMTWRFVSRIDLIDDRIGISRLEQFFFLDFFSMTHQVKEKKERKGVSSRFPLFWFFQLPFYPAQPLFVSSSLLLNRSSFSLLLPSSFIQKIHKCTEITRKLSFLF